MNEKHNNPSIVIKSSIWYTLSGFIAKSMGFITTPLYSRLLSTEEYGNFHVYANWQILFAILCGMEVASTFNRARFDFKEKEAFDSYISSCLVLTTITTTVLCLFFIIFPRCFESILGMNRGYICYMFIYLLFLPALDIFQTKQMINYNYKLSTIISFSSAIVCSSMAMGLAYLIDSNRLLGRIIGQYMPIALLGISMYIILFISCHKIKFSYWKYALTLSIPIMLSSLAGQVLTSSDKVIVQQLNTAEEVAYVGLATTVSHIMTIFVGAINGAWSPYYYNKLYSKDYVSIRKGYRLLFGIVLFVSLWVVLLGPEIVKILGGNKYDKALYLIPPSVVIGITIAVVNQYGALEIFHKKSKYIAIFTAIAAVFNIGLDIMFVGKWGYITVSYVTVVCYIILILLHMFVTKRLGATEYLQPKLVIVTLTIGVGLIVMGVIIYPFMIVRYCLVGMLIIASVVLMCVERKLVLGLLKSWLISKNN